MKYELRPVRSKPIQRYGWGTKRFKKPDKYNFRGEYRVEYLVK